MATRYFSCLFEASIVQIYYIRYHEAHRLSIDIIDKGLPRGNQ